MSEMGVSREVLPHQLCMHSLASQVQNPTAMVYLRKWQSSWKFDILHFTLQFFGS